jgi:hypothetical protein
MCLYASQNRLGRLLEGSKLLQGGFSIASKVEALPTRPSRSYPRYSVPPALQRVRCLLLVSRRSARPTTAGNSTLLYRDLLNVRRRRTNLLQLNVLPLANAECRLSLSYSLPADFSTSQCHHTLLRSKRRLFGTARRESTATGNTEIGLELSLGTSTSVCN